MDKIAVLIPCYNEVASIHMVIEKFHEALPEAVVYVYDNNSTDGTDKKAAQAGAVVRYERHQGKGNVIRSMFREIEAECYFMVDGDDTYSPGKAREMCDLILNHEADMAVGDRLSSNYLIENSRAFHNFGNLLVRAIVNRLFHSNVHDVMTGCRAFSRFFVKNFPVLSHGFEIETEMTIHALDKKFKVASLPIEYKERGENSVSKLNTFSDGFRVLKTVFALLRDYRPLLFFSTVALFLVLVGAGLLVPVFINYFETGLVPRFPTLIVGCFVVQIGR